MFREIADSMTPDMFSSLAKLRFGATGFGKSPEPEPGTDGYDLVDLISLTDSFAPVSPEAAGDVRSALERAVDQAYKNGIRHFRVCSLFGLELLKKYPDIRIVTSEPLPVCNSLAALELQSFGVERIMAHIELEKKAVEELDTHSPLPLELYRLGRPALLTTRAAIPAEGALRDARGNEFEVRSDGKSKLTRLYARQVLSLPRLPGVYDFYDLTNARWRSNDTATFNFDAELG